MRAETIADTLTAAGLEPNRDVPVYNPQHDGPSECWVVRDAIIATSRHGVVWRGDLDLDREAHLLRHVAQELDQKLYVVDEKGAEALPCKGASKALIAEAIWWSTIGPYDKDVFGAIGLYDAWHPPQRRARTRPTAPGRNWRSEVEFVGSRTISARRMPFSRSRGRVTKPVMMHRTSLCELIWFNSKHAILQEDFDRIRSTFGQVAYWLDEACIHVYKGDELVAVARPSPVPNRETFAAATHELALRNLPRSQQSLIELIKTHLEPVHYSGAEDLWRCVNRLLDAFEERDCSHTWTMRGITEWRRCKQVKALDATHVFQGTEVPVSRLFYAFLQGKPLRDFLVENPTVSKKQIECVLEHAIESIDG